MADLSFTEEELEEIERLKDKFPTAKAATLRVLWLAQNKYGHVKDEVQRLVAETLDLPKAHVHGVARFYTQYYKEEKGKFVLDVCTCLSCQLCGGYDILHHLEDELDIEAGETTDDGMFTINEVECLGACGYAPMLQVTNGVYVNNLTKEKVDKLIKNLRNGNMPEFESMAMPELEKRNQAASE
ncbi:NAD(P)H-dependent oxidoreductase subunit E [Aliifodinibius salipaludis]|uniref:NAD(P)H-dependent oxidoreductase subunit E n=1 Tax=Fodinibius salipaludis TaxID=2032627 RepID=A0A2A2G9L8_9BACT|nr:NAD(P)H-dependent oxidoreductase subunit E [Aliifodinibius salipaludis]PAU93998.1 NAD(P)H-dependent oxidoreductase subunit E [Aliifodinibius salipaludis]